MENKISEKANQQAVISTDETANRLFAEIRPLIEETRGRVSQTVNSVIVMLYWTVGKKIFQAFLIQLKWITISL